MKAPVALGLGANVGTREEIAGRFRHALDVLGEAGTHGLRVGDLRVASLYRTAALSKDGEPLDQPDYLNTAAVGHMHVPPQRDLAWGARRLLRRIKEVEAAAGRDVGPGDDGEDRPRRLDLDLLLLGDAELHLERRDDLSDALWPGPIRVPHPRLAERRFVLRPLAELSPDRVLPGDGRTVAAALAGLDTGAGEEGERAQRVEKVPGGI